MWLKDNNVDGCLQMGVQRGNSELGNPELGNPKLMSYIDTGS